MQLLIESIGLPAKDLRDYLLEEVEEFINASSLVEKQSEFGDMLFALMAMSWAHSNQHYDINGNLAKVFDKICARLRKYGTVSRVPSHFEQEAIKEMNFGVIHFSFGKFCEQITDSEALKNGTVFELKMLFEVAFQSSRELTNHCVITFNSVDQIKFNLIRSSGCISYGNVVICRVPDFLYLRAKRELLHEKLAELLTLQVLAAIDKIQFCKHPIAHFHSWECGLLCDQTEFRKRIEDFHKIFSPYLTVTRLQSLMETVADDTWTVTQEKASIAAKYERKLCELCTRTVFESSLDAKHYSNFLKPSQIDLCSFATVRYTSFVPEMGDRAFLKFLAGGRPVKEKGFIELCCEFALLRKWAKLEGINLSLELLCRDSNPNKGIQYLNRLENTIQRLGLKDCVSILHKVSLPVLQNYIQEKSAVIVPSLFDPYCLMPHYAIQANIPAFVSCFAGVSENISSREYVFDIQKPGSLSLAIQNWYKNSPTFEFSVQFPSYEKIYLTRD